MAILKSLAYVFELPNQPCFNCALHKLLVGRWGFNDFQSEVGGLCYRAAHLVLAGKFDSEKRSIHIGKITLAAQ
jgi:hypothetical protein